MSDIIPLQVTLELPFSEFADQPDGPQVRCQKCSRFVTLADYYSEQQGQLLPLVGNAKCAHTEIERTTATDEHGNEVVTAVEHVSGCDWSECVRVLPDTTPPPEGGTLAFNVADAVASTEKFG